MSKKCIYCQVEKDVSDFPKHKRMKNGIDTRCKECIKQNARIANKIRRTAPPKPDICQLCKKKKEKIVLDHDHITRQFRGWLCDACNRAIGQLGDNLEGLRKAINYLSKDKE